MPFDVFMNIEPFSYHQVFVMDYHFLGNTLWSIILSLFACLVLQMVSVHQLRNPSTSKPSRSLGVVLTDMRLFARWQSLTNDLISSVPPEWTLLLLECLMEQFSLVWSSQLVCNDLIWFIND